MNRKKLFGHLDHTLITSDLVPREDYSWDTLTSAGHKKCKQRFDSYKPDGCSRISHHEHEKMLRENGIEASEEQILKMLWEADPKGQGFIEFECFCAMVENYKKKKYDEISNFIGLTFDSVLEEQRKRLNDSQCCEVTWEFLVIYLRDNFDLGIGVHSLIGKNRSKKPLSRHEFMNIFS